MPSESNGNEHTLNALADEVTPRSPWRVTEVEALPDFRLRVAFADGLTGTVELSGLVHSSRAGVDVYKRQALSSPSVIRISTCLGCFASATSLSADAATAS